MVNAVQKHKVQQNQKYVRQGKPKSDEASIASGLHSLHIGNSSQVLKEPAQQLYLKSLLEVPESMKPAQKRILKTADALFHAQETFSDPDAFLKKYIPIRLSEVHHACFLKGISWSTDTYSKIRLAIHEELNQKSFNQFQSPEAVLKLDSYLASIQEPYSYNGYGGQFEESCKVSFCTSHFKRLPAPQYKCTNGEIFELIDSLSAEQTQKLSKIMHRTLKQGPAIVGKGGVATVKYAYHPRSKMYFAAKEFMEFSDADEEAEISQQIPGDPHFLNLLGYVHAYHGNTYKKSLLIFPLLAYGDGKSYVQRICKDLNFKKIEDRMIAKKTAYSFLLPVARFHECGFVHRDIKLENFLVNDNGQMILCDFSFSEKLTTPKQQYKHIHAGTDWYLPSTFNSDAYTGLHHDQAALALLFLGMLKGKPVYDKHELQVKIEKQSITIHFYTIQAGENSWVISSGVNRKALQVSLDKYTNITEISVGMLDTDQSTRLTPQQALALPYFDDIKDMKITSPLKK